MKPQINLRLSDNLLKKAERYAKLHGFRNIQELATDSLRQKLMEKEVIKETFDVMKHKELMTSIRRSLEDVKKGRIISWEELQRRWKTNHAKK